SHLCRTVPHPATKSRPKTIHPVEFPIFRRVPAVWQLGKLLVILRATRAYDSGGERRELQAHKLKDSKLCEREFASDRATSNREYSRLWPEGKHRNHRRHRLWYQHSAWKELRSEDHYL